MFAIGWLLQWPLPAASRSSLLAHSVITIIPETRRLAVFLLVAVLGLVSAARLAHAQDMEPRAYSASPINTNFLLATYGHVAGAVSLDPALPISNVRGVINSGFIGYDRTFDLLGSQRARRSLFPRLRPTCAAMSSTRARKSPGWAWATW